MGKRLSVLTVIAFASPALAGNAFDDYATKIYKQYIWPHFEHYEFCATEYFFDLGQKRSEPFAKIETTVRGTCGQHIDLARNAMTNLGMPNRAAQSRLIGTVYNKMLPRLRDAYVRGQHSKAETAVTGFLQKEWEDCLMQFAAQAALTNPDTADVIVRGTWPICQKQENAVYANMLANAGPDLKDFVVDSLYPALHRSVENRLFAVVLAARSGAATKQSAPEQQKPSPSL